MAPKALPHPATYPRRVISGCPGPITLGISGCSVVTFPLRHSTIFGNTSRRGNDCFSAVASSTRFFGSVSWTDIIDTLRVFLSHRTRAIASMSRRTKNRSKVVETSKPRLLAILGPGLVTGAADDDPSGIATYSQAGAKFGFSLTWTLLFTYPLMAVIQEISARIGRTTGKGIAANIRNHYPNAIVQCIVLLLVIANTINIGADLG